METVKRKKKSKNKEHKKTKDDPNSLIYWDYGEKNGPSVWAERFPEARKHHQSPIDIGVKDLTKLVVKQPLELNGCENFHKCDKCQVTNVGYTVQVLFPGKCNQIVILEGGPLEFDYHLGKLEFHWGSGEIRGGGEHSFAGKSYAGEAHFIFYKKGITTFEEALEKSDGIAIVCVLIDIGIDNKQCPHPTLELFLNELKGIQKFTSTVEVPGWYLIEWLKDTVTPYGWYTYRGSITYPPCTQNVSWFIFTEPTQANAKIFANFFRLEDHLHHKIINNRRPTQPINNRPIFKALSPHGITI